MSATFDAFLETFLGTLSQNNFYQGQSLPQYLSRHTDERRNDEADIVDDKISSVLIQALGYSLGERQYNRSHGAGKRTDFTVRIPPHEYPKPCAVIESKNTATEHLEQHLPQLESYLRAQGAQRGILIDGKRLIAYELANPVPVATADLSLYNLVSLWRGELLFAEGKKGKDALPRAELTQLRAFWARFHRGAYTDASRLVRELTRTKSGEPHARDGSTWNEEHALLAIRKPDDASFVKEVRDLISDVRTDVEAQLTLRLETFESFQKQLDYLPETQKKASDTYQNLLEALLASLERVGFGEEDRDSVRFRLAGQLEQRTERSLIDGLGKELLARVNEQLRRNARAGTDERPKGDSTETPLLEGAVKTKTQTRAAKQTSLTEDLTRTLTLMQKLLSDYHRRRERLQGRYEAEIAVSNAFEAWREKVATLLLRGADQERLRREFAAQTAYVLIVRMLLVRIAEDKGILERTFTNGGLSLWFDQVEPRYLKYAQGRGTDYLLEMAYTSAQHVYAHFYTERLLFDWYAPERNLVIRVLHRLAGYDLSTIDNDVIGHVYGGYFEDEHKHESGMYYTPPEVVEYILDRLEYSGPKIVGSKILDPASGSGTFLVSAARRLVQAHRQYHQNAGHADIPIGEIQTVLDSIKNSLYGLDLNPFACYLAETNLLIQVLDLIKRAFDGGESVTLDRFHVYNADTLSYEPELAAIARGTIAFSADELDLVDQLKIKRGRTTDAGGSELDFGQGFDFVVANPPYVRADEGGQGMLEYRRRIREEHPVTEVREVLVKKWDLFVPFVALGWYLLGENGRLGMITSDAIEMAPYGDVLRTSILKKGKIEEISFFPGVKLFADASVRNTVFIFEKTSVDASHKTLRRWHSGFPPSVSKENRLSQLENGANIFRQAVANTNYVGTLALGDICFISAGMELQAHEGKSQGEFKKENLIALEKSEQHPVPYVEARDVAGYELLRVRYLEYGPSLRAPEQVRRPRFPELFKSPKLGTPMVVSSKDPNQAQVFLDSGAHHDGWLFTNHSIHIIVPWHELKGTDNRSISNALGERSRDDVEKTSEKFALPYLQGILNSPWMSQYIRAKRRDHTNLYPDDFKDIPIPDVDADVQKPISEAAVKAHNLGLEFSNLRERGWKINTLSQKVEAAAILPDGVPSLPLATAKVRWSLRVHDDGADLTSLSRRGSALWRGRKEVVSVSESAGETGEGGLEWLRRQFAGLTAGTTWAMAEARGVRVPQSPGEAVRALQTLVQQEDEVREKVAEFGRLKAEVDMLVAALYEGGSAEVVSD